MAATAEKPKVHRYVVVSDAVVVTIGKKSNGKAEYTRVLRGGVINGTEGSEQIAELVRKGALVQVTSKDQLAQMQADLKKFPYDARDASKNSRHRQTVKQAAAKMGAPDDPVQPPQQSILPVPAPLPETDPDAIFANTEQA